MKHSLITTFGVVTFVTANFLAVGCGLKPEVSHTDDPLQGTGVNSTYSLTFRVYENGEAKDELISLKRSEITRNNNETINLAHDYSLHVLEGLQDPKEFLPVQTSLNKWGPKGLSSEIPMSADAHFSINFFTLEKMIPGKLYHCTDKRKDPVCNFSLNLPASTVLSTNELGEATTRKIFDIDQSRLSCNVQVGQGGSEFNMSDETSPDLGRSYRRSSGIPVNPNSNEREKKFSILFKCEDKQTGKTAVYGYLLQNTNDIPSLAE